MVSVNQRGWTTIDFDADTPDTDTPRGRAVSARADALMQEWSIIHHTQEQRAFARDWDREDGGWYDPRNCDCTERSPEDDDLCVHDYDALQTEAHTIAVRDEGERLKLELIEAELANFNIRPMRPYEHHNEDERYYQYMEEGRFGHYSD